MAKGAFGSFFGSTMGVLFALLFVFVGLPMCACGGCFVLAIIGSSQSSRNAPSSSSSVTTGKSANAPPIVHAVPYRIIEEWTVPNGGYVRIIVIDPVHRNEQDMRELGDSLRYDTKDDRNAVVFVYDDEKAARMRKDALAEQLSEQDLADHDTHMIGHYTRNINSGFHALNIVLDGIDGPSIEVKY
jgi:hypothetical protein